MYSEIENPIGQESMKTGLDLISIMPQNKKTFSLFFIFTLSLLPPIGNGISGVLADGPLFAYDLSMDTYSNSIFPISRDSTDSKTPIKAFIIALFPGSAMHGLGHWYIGKKKTFGILFGLEMVPILYILLPLETTIGIGAEVGDPFFMSFFFSTWLYDMIASPIQCYRMNKMKKITSIRPFMAKNQFGGMNAGLRLSIPF